MCEESRQSEVVHGAVRKAYIHPRTRLNPLPPLWVRVAFLLSCPRSKKPHRSKRGRCIRYVPLIAIGRAGGRSNMPHCAVSRSNSAVDGCLGSYGRSRSRHAPSSCGTTRRPAVDGVVERRATHGALEDGFMGALFLEGWLTPEWPARGRRHQLERIDRLPRRGLRGALELGCWVDRL